MENKYVLQMKNIYKSFGGLHALTDVSLDLGHGEILGLVGDNAAGKSTLMKILTGAYQIDEGKIFFEGREVFITNPRKSKQLGIEMIYQNLELCPNLDVPANLFLGREVVTKTGFGFLKKRIMERQAVDILRKLKIDIRNPRIKVNKLSGGQQQAVAIGRAVSFDPKIVVMDEPTANLALVEIEKVRELTLVLKEHGISIIFISHRLDDIFRVSDRIFVLKHGREAVIKETAKTDKEEIIKAMFMETQEQ
ncbi:MAG: sugar ABC transporter ATP-binding protein [Syntrophaceae bacterium]|nr:sugar ABC transporter ATP-binding protein [Syntrophaceae bacterium]